MNQTINPEKESTNIDLGFYDENIDNKDLSGNILNDNSHIESFNSNGATSIFLRKRGFGWMLEVEETEADMRKPLLEELDIDVKDIYYKTRSVLLPFPYFGLNRQVVRDKPDFWGPLFVVILYALVSLVGQFRVVSWIIIIWLIGSCIIYVIARSLGGEVYYAQCLGVIGYSLLPMLIMCLISPLLLYISKHLANFCRLFGVIWAAYSAGSLLCLEELQKKRILLLYPIGLLYIYFFSLYTGA